MVSSQETPRFNFKKIGKMEIRPTVNKEIKIRIQSNEIGNENPNRDKGTKSLFFKKNE